MSVDEAAGSGRRADVLAELLAGNRRFVDGTTRHDRRRPGPDRLPHTAVLSCMDGRVPVESAFDQDAGAICAIRSAGPVLDRSAHGSVELAVTVLGVDLVLVLGHLRCAAVEAAIAAGRTGNRPAGEAAYVTDQIAPAVSEAGEGAGLAEVVRAHVRRTVATLRRPLAPLAGDAPQVAGAVYDLDSGEVTLLD